MSRRSKPSGTDGSRRNFLRTVGAGVPTLRLLLENHPASGAGWSEQAAASGKFTPLDLTHAFNASPTDFGPHEQAKGLSGDPKEDGLLRMPAGKQTFRGIPFLLGPEGLDRKRWICLTTRGNAWSSPQMEIPLGKAASFICLAAFCDWDPNETPPPGPDAVERVGQRLADAVLVYDESSETPLPIRRRFEVNQPTVDWGHLAYAAEAQLLHAPRKLTDPLQNGMGWGELQTAVLDNSYPGGPDGRALAIVWISALANPKPQQPLKALRLEARAEDALFACGVTLFHGRENPLRFERLSLYRITLPEPAAEDAKRWEVGVDLGIVARKFVPPSFSPEAWLAAQGPGLGEREQRVRQGRYLYAQIAASTEATLTLRDTQTGQRYEFDLGQVTAEKELEARPAGARIEILEHEKVWLRGQVVDAASGRPTPARLAFRSKEGRYIPPYGHRTDINDGWFEDYGADVKLMDTSFAYIDGTFTVELPVGEVYVELTKGFEYLPVRKKLAIEPGQRELKLEVSRFLDLRKQGWIAADTHVHFLSPSTAILEGQAEGLNLINLLAAQWADLFTNVGDLAQGPLTSKDGEMLVQVSTENRQHLLGHLGLLGVHGDPVYPLSASGPGESSMGDPLWTSLADWAETCRERQGLVVAVHFPYPTAELAADIVLGKIDAVELYPYTRHFNTLRYFDWYRYLNCGYRLPAVGGTDKMGAYMPAGANRTYAYLGREEFSFANWAKAVRSGNTFATTGPLLLFKVDGHAPGEEITLGAGDGTMEVQVEARGFVPFHSLEVVNNGRVVASREAQEGTRELTLREHIKVEGPGWLAARCSSKLGPTTAWGFALAAHTSPVYVKVPGQELFSASGAAYMLTLIDGAQTWVENLATRPGPESYARVVKVFQDARERLHQRMHEHGISH